MFELFTDYSGRLGVPNKDGELAEEKGYMGRLCAQDEMVAQDCLYCGAKKYWIHIIDCMTNLH